MTDTDKLDQRWKDAEERYKKADKEAIKAMRNALPIGRRVVWMVGEHMQMGEVLDVSEYSYHLARVKVRSGASDKEYWLYAYRILDQL